MAEKLFRPWVNISTEKIESGHNLREGDNNSTMSVSVEDNNIKSSCEGINGIVNKINKKEKYITGEQSLNESWRNFVDSFNTSLHEDSDPRFPNNQFSNIIYSNNSTNSSLCNSASFISYLHNLKGGFYRPPEMFPQLDEKDQPYGSSCYLNFPFPNTCRFQHASIHDVPSISLNNLYETVPTFPPSVEKAAELVNLQDVAAKQIKKLRPKKFRCEYCDVAFSNNGQLKGHVRIHTGERPYKCDSEGCGKSFTRNEELTRHKRIHTGLRPHSCSACGKKFGRKDHLKKHTRTHENRDLLYNVSTSLSVFSLGMFI